MITGFWFDQRAAGRPSRLMSKAQGWTKAVSVDRKGPVGSTWMTISVDGWKADNTQGSEVDFLSYGQGSSLLNIFSQKPLRSFSNS